MSKRVDFSLGMSAVSSGDAFGDIFDEEPLKPRLPNITMTSATPRSGSRENARNSEDHNSLAHTTSRDSTGSKLHKNRFFSRKGRSNTRDEGRAGTSLDDLEAGTARNRQFSVFDMPDIPEASGSNTNAFVTPPPGVVQCQENVRDREVPGVGVNRASTMPHTQTQIHERERERTQIGGRIDPRTGIISPQAVARDSALERGELPRQV